MDSFLWELPGLRQFVADITEDLREGRNVIIVLPKYLPRGLYRAARRKIDRENIGLLENISAESISQSSPVYDLHHLYNSDAIAKEKIDIQSLCRCENFKSRVIWLENIWQMGKKSWEWVDFLKNYAFACASQDLISRTVFAVPIHGELTMGDLPVENLLSQHWFWGRVSSIDLQIFAAQMLSTVKVGTHEKRLLINTIATLCGHDLEVAENLCRQILAEESDPEIILNNLVSERQWDNSGMLKTFERVNKIGRAAWFQTSNRPSQELVQGWSEGLIDKIDGRVVTSPVAEIARGNDEEIKLRIWRGHTQSLLPIIDEYRLKVIQHLETNYHMNLKSWNKNKRDILEIGAIKYHIETDPKLRKRIDKDLLSLIRLLTKIRNNLAHLTPVSKERRQRLEEAIKAIF